MNAKLCKTLRRIFRGKDATSYVCNKAKGTEVIEYVRLLGKRTPRYIERDIMLPVIKLDKRQPIVLRHSCGRARYQRMKKIFAGQYHLPRVMGLHDRPPPEFTNQPRA